MQKQGTIKMDSTVTLVGNLTRDPIVRVTGTGVAVAELSVAVNRRWRAGDGDERESTSYFSVVAWRSLAEHCAASLHKGDLVMVVGRPEQRSWQTESGDRRSTVEIVADDIGPSLRWATAEVQRTARRTGEGALGAA
ncbi:MAG: single-stranded DNA-binding protein [Acidimicrobiales bacterium]